MHERVQDALEAGSLPRPLNTSARAVLDRIAGQEITPEHLANELVDAKVRFTHSNPIIVALTPFIRY
jgi:hypothetical protein